MVGFLSSLKEQAQQGLTQAQAALDKKGYDFKIPTGGMATHTTQAQQPLDQHGNVPGPGGSTDLPDGKPGRGFFVENITHQLRAMHNQYAPGGPPDVQKLQVLITNAKGVSLDYQGAGRDTKAHSKDLYLWGQAEDEDIKDVTDRLAFIHFIDGSLATTLSDKLDDARGPLKKLREAQVQVGPRRAQRAAIEADIKKAQNNPQRVQELHQTLQKHIQDDSGTERDLGELKRTAIRDSEIAKWDAIREYAEKLLLVADAGKTVAQQLPTSPPTSARPYAGHKVTAGARSALQEAIDNWRPGTIALPGKPVSARPTEAWDARSFGESHASELSRVSSFSAPVGPTPAVVHAPELPITQPKHAPMTASPQSTMYSIGEAQGSGVGGFTHPSSHPQAVHQSAGPSQASSSPSGGPHALNPAVLNNAPAPIPAPVISPAVSAPAHVETPASVISPAAASEGQFAVSTAPIQPTVAETGIPLSAGDKGPGPASGSLLHKDGPPPDFDAPSYNPGGFKPPGQEDEKKRLEREERDRILAAGGSQVGAGAYSVPYDAPPPSAVDKPKYESAEDEKKRLEREEREKILRGEASGGGGGPPKPSGTPPPYS